MAQSASSDMRYRDHDTAEQVADDVRQANPRAQVRVLPDGSVAMLIDLIFTRAVCLGCTSWGWSRRFCFEDRDRATQVFAELVSEDDEPTGCTAFRG